MGIALLVQVPIFPGDPSNMCPRFPPLIHAIIHLPQSVCLNDNADWNMLSMLPTLDTSHLDRSPLNDDAE